jgi:hypothetical protein
MDKRGGVLKSPFFEDTAVQGGIAMSLFFSIPPPISLSKKAHLTYGASLPPNHGIYIVSKYDVACNARLSDFQPGIFASTANFILAFCSKSGQKPIFASGSCVKGENTITCLCGRERG